MIAKSRAATPDLQAAMDGINIGAEDGVNDILAASHAGMGAAMAEYRQLMGDDASTRSVLAQDLSMQLELHMASMRDVLYPELQPHHADAIAGLLEAHQDMQECIETLRGLSAADAELDSTMLRLMEIAECYMAAEKALLGAGQGTRDLAQLGAAVMARRKQIAGAVEDLETRS